jgi:non-ribosomal peptide synthetase component F
MAILGVLRAGGAYVPVDWGYPQDRIDFIVEDSEAAAVEDGTTEKGCEIGAKQRKEMGWKRNRK